MEEPIRDNSQRSKDLKMVFYIALGINAILILLYAYRSYMVQNYDFSRSQLNTINFLDVSIRAAYLLRAIINIVTIIFFVRWFKRAYGNLIIKKQPMRYSETGTVWGFFIPLVNLYRPSKAGKEIYLKTQYAIKELNSNFKIDSNTSFISIWWILFWIALFFEGNANNELGASTDVTSFVSASGYVIIAKGITIIAIICALYFIHKVSKVETTLKDTNISVSEIDAIGKPVV